MNKKSTRIVSALTLSLCLVSNMVLVPASARGGFGGGGGRSFGGFGGGGGRSFGGFGGGGRDFGGGGRDFGGGNRDFGGGNRDFGGSGISSRPVNRDGLPTDGGLGGFGNFTNRANHPTPINQGNLNNQGNKIRDNFNNNNRFSGNDINNVNNNSVNFNHYGNNNGWGHGYGYGYGGYGGYGHWGPYGYPGGWYCPGWSQATAWTCMGMSTLTSFLGMGMMGAALANSGDGGGNSGNSPSVTNITYEGDNVYYNGKPQGSSSDYYQQAQQLANNGTATTASADDSANWQPLGVFALAEPGQSDSNMMLQMAINKDGMVRGNYLNQLTNETSQLFGALDKKTQRVSWTIGNNNTTVFDAMLGDLVKNDSQVLVHYGPKNTKTMALIRLPAPPDPGNGGSATPGNNS